MSSPYDYDGFAEHLRQVQPPAADFLTRRFTAAASGPWRLPK